MNNVKFNDIKTAMIEIKKHRHEELLVAAQAAIEADQFQTVELEEKGDRWTVLAMLSECWLEWALGQVFWEPIQRPVPDWAAELRAEWDSAWK